jgi:hypothetical protein
MQHYYENNQDEALEAYDKLMAYYNEADDMLKAPWPDEYGGCYIDKSNRFVICVTDANDKVMEKYEAICGENVLFIEVEHSFRNLLNAFDCLTAYKSSSVNSIGLSSRDNIVEIKLYDKSEINDIETFLNSTLMDTRELSEGLIKYTVIEKETDTDSNHSFSKSQKNKTSAATTRTASTRPDGTSINNQVYTDAGLLNYFTLGVWAVRNVGVSNVYGFITCGHAFYNGGNFRYSNTSVYLGEGSSIDLGYALPIDVSISGLDYAFVTVDNPNYVPTTNMANGGTISTLYSSAPSEGTTVYFYGASGGFSYGEVLTTLVYNTPYIGPYNGFVIDYTSESNGYNGIKNHDSGGPHYIIQNNVRKLVGFQSSADDPAGDENRFMTAFAARAYLVFDALGVSIYS